MERSWGRAVTENGFINLRLQNSALVWSDCTLASRQLPLSSPPVWITNATFGNFFLAVVIPADTQLPYGIVAPNKAAGHPHFPYGRTVEPDTPV